MNKNPFWKYILLVAILVPAILFALPNIYDNDPGIQVKGLRGQAVNENTLSTIESVLSNAGIQAKGIDLGSDSLKVRFANESQQQQAKDLIRDTLGESYSSALASMSTSPNWLAGMGAIPMYLGLDLRGGVHFLIQVDWQDAVNKRMPSIKREIQTLLRKEKVRSAGSTVLPGQGVEIKFRSDDERNEAFKNIIANFQELELTPVDRGDTFYLKALVTETAIDEIKRSAIQKNMVALRNRIDELGVAEPVLQQQGLDRIVVQLPGVQDPVKAREILGNTATLEVYLVDEKNQGRAGRGTPPVGSKLYNFRDGQPILLKKRLVYSGDCVVDATSGFEHQTGGPIVNITLDARCAEINRKVTGENLQKQMAIVYAETNTKIEIDTDGKQTPITTKTEEVLTAPTIQDVLGSRFQISGLDSSAEAQSLALTLRAGSLNTPIFIVEERTIGPSLGKANIEKGFKSVLYGFIAVLIFMVVYYRMFGSVASIALIVNLIVIVAVLSLFQATLTLPGVAGIVLTVGMAVDANVLIFERIREEIRAGAQPQAAIHSGYDRAFSTIIDANITTLIAALVLFNFGTGPIKGFAITLSIGILTSMFTAIFLTRVLVNWLYGGKKLSKLPI